VVGGGLKIAYDFALLAIFRKVRPPEEDTGSRQPACRPG
jgi:hypothetical protein